jgi:Flp pilus assembly protein TadG
MGRTRGELGSLTVELVVLTPVLFALGLAALAFGRVSEARQQVVEASRAGAEAAAVLPNTGSAQWGAAATAAVGIHSQIDTDTSHFYPGGYVTVTVACQVDLSGVSIPGIPSSTTVTASATAPIDPYRAIG